MSPAKKKRSAHAARETKLVQAFAVALPYVYEGNLHRTIDKNDLMMVLGIDEDHIGALFGAGVLRTLRAEDRPRDRVRPAELLRFAKAHGANWFHQRYLLLLRALRDGVAKERRDRRTARDAAPAGVIQ